MSANSGDAAEGVTAFPRSTGFQSGGTPVQKKRGCGCVSTVTGAILFVIGVAVLLHPWALHMGGRWTPALTWHGVGKLHSTSGATYGLFLQVNLYFDYRRRSSPGSSQSLEGTAKICTPQGELYPLTVSGYLKHAWLDAEGKQLTFYFRSVKDAKPKLNFDLYGSWQGQELVLEDKGNMAMSFTADGHAKGYLQGMNAPAENATGRLRYAMESEFASVCGEAKSSF